MNVILNTNKNSCYAKYNGLTFKVVDFLSTIIAINIDGHTVDFSFKEVFIVDIEREVALCSHAVKVGLSNYTKNDFKNLKQYVIVNRINLPNFKFSKDENI